jgi:membrane protein involved in colicin uptake
MIISAIAVILLIAYMFALGSRIRRYKKQDKEEAEEAKRRAEEEAQRAAEEEARRVEEAARRAEEEAAHTADESAYSDEETAPADDIVIPDVPAVKEAEEISPDLPEPDEEKPPLSEE